MRNQVGRIFNVPVSEISEEARVIAWLAGEWRFWHRQGHMIF